jgi:hypothetical protein
VEMKQREINGECVKAQNTGSGKLDYNVQHCSECDTR